MPSGRNCNAIDPQDSAPARDTPARHRSGHHRGSVFCACRPGASPLRPSVEFADHVEQSRVGSRRLPSAPRAVRRGRPRAGHRASPASAPRFGRHRRCPLPSPPASGRAGRATGRARQGASLASASCSQRRLGPPRPSSGCASRWPFMYSYISRSLVSLLVSNGSAAHNGPPPCQGRSAAPGPSRCCPSQRPGNRAHCVSHT